MVMMIISAGRIENEKQRPPWLRLNPDEAPSPKRALIVNACGLRWPSAVVRAWQYHPLFNRCSTWCAEYTSLRSEFWEGLLCDEHRQRWQYHIDAFRRPLTALALYRNKQKEDQVVERAADADIVSVVKVGSLQLYRRLLQLGRPRVLMDINDAIWLPWFGFHDLEAMLAGTRC